MSSPHFNTLRVKNKHHVLVNKTFNPPMKSVGERIRQAREFRGLSGQELAELVGYKHQSAIGNLENRATGNGGNKLVEIARALNFSVHWFLSGPDTHDMRNVAPFASATAQESSPIYLPAKPPTRQDFALPDWPFEHITAQEYALLSPKQQGMIEGYIRSLIDHSAPIKSTERAA